MRKLIASLLILSFLAPDALAAISAVTASGNVAGSITGANVTLTSPAGTTTGDVLVIVFAQHSGSTTQVTAISNGTHSFTQLVFLHAAASTALGIWYYVVQAGDATTWTLTNTGNIEAGIMAYRGVDTTTPIDAQGTEGTSANTINAVVTATANAWVIGSVAWNVATTGLVTATSLSNTRINAGNGGASTTKAAVFQGDAIVASPGSSGSYTVTAANTATESYAFALRPIVAAIPTTPCPSMGMLGVGCQL